MAQSSVQEVRLGVAEHWVPVMECLWPVSSFPVTCLSCTPRKHHFHLCRLVASYAGFEKKSCIVRILQQVLFDFFFSSGKHFSEFGGSGVMAHVGNWII